MPPEIAAALGMKVKRFLIPMIVCALSARLFGAPQPVDYPELLGRAQAVNENLYRSLQSFVCDETVLRSRASLDDRRVRPLDVLTAKVSFENGSEHYTEIRRNGRVRARMSDVPGAWSEGEFGTLLRQTEQLLKSQRVTLSRLTHFGVSAAALYTFDVAEADSPWSLIVEGRSYRISFRTAVWIEQSSGQILRVERSSTTMPQQTYISELTWSVSLSNVNVNGAAWLLPVSGEYSVLYAAQNRREWNRLTFSNYHRYGSEVALRFEQTAAVEPTARRGSEASPSRYER